MRLINQIIGFLKQIFEKICLNKINAQNGSDNIASNSSIVINGDKNTVIVKQKLPMEQLIAQNTNSVNELDNKILLLLDTNASRQNPITHHKLWELFVIEFGMIVKETEFAKRCIFLCGKNKILKIGNGDPTVNPSTTFYYM